MEQLFCLTLLVLCTYLRASTPGPVSPPRPVKEAGSFKMYLAATQFVSLCVCDSLGLPGLREGEREGRTMPRLQKKTTRRGSFTTPFPRGGDLLVENISLLPYRVHVCVCAKRSATGRSKVSWKIHLELLNSAYFGTLNKHRCEERTFWDTRLLAPQFHSRRMKGRHRKIGGRNFLGGRKGVEEGEHDKLLSQSNRPLWR